MAHTPINIALDWTPNTNHTGFFVAQALGYYEQARLKVTILDPSTDNYAVTPAKKLELGQVDFAIAPTESAISLNTKANKAEAKAVAAILQEDASAIAVLASSDINRPAALDGRSYASYGARYEDKIVQQMVRNDGGKGELYLSYPDKLGIWNTLLENKADATWIFQNWEGVEAETQGIELRCFELGDYGIPYGYSPVLLAMSAQIEKSREPYQAFLQATKAGYLHALENPESAARMLGAFVTAQDRERIDLVKAQKRTNPYYGTAQTWGQMDAARVSKFVTWLKANNIEATLESIEPIFTNELLSGSGT
jgi:ABC-type nitrate/sulfonate/bicarbonate transport system substrate-binding protein